MSLDARLNMRTLPLAPQDLKQRKSEDAVGLQSSAVRGFRIHRMLASATGYAAPESARTYGFTGSERRNAHVSMPAHRYGRPRGCAAGRV